MNERINFLKFFFESGKEADDVLVERVTDLFPVPAFVYDLEKDEFRYINRRFAAYFGWSNIEGKEKIYSLDHHEELDCIKAELKNLEQLNENDNYYFTCKFTNQSGVVGFFKLTGSVVSRSLNGRARLTLVVAQEITDLVRSNEEVDTKSALLKDTEELLQFGSWNWDAATDKVVWSDGLFKLLQFEDDDRPVISNAMYMSFVLPEQRDEVVKAIMASLSEKKGYEVEYSIRTRRGDIKIVSTIGKVVLNDQGEIKTVFGITRDITAIRNFEREQEKSLRELNRSNKELEEFAYVASHDLQEPLRKIAMFSERLKTKLGDTLDKDSQLFMDRILVASANMKTLIDNLLEFSRANRSSQAFEKIELRQVLEKVISTFELKIEETRTRITGIETLPAIEAVASEMDQLFSNLISNAIKFRKDNEDPQIALSCFVATREEKLAHRLLHDKKYFKIQIRDNGIGFEEEYSEKIFQIFQRLHGKTEYPGSGIGLAICKRIVDNHSGLIQGQSTPGEGAIFTILLPEKQF